MNYNDNNNNNNDNKSGGHNPRSRIPSLAPARNRLSATRSPQGSDSAAVGLISYRK